jgi:hypothetical protein
LNFNKKCDNKIQNKFSKVNREQFQIFARLIMKRLTMSENKEKELIIAAQKGDITAFEQLISLYQQKIFNIAYFKVQDPSSCRRCFSRGNNQNF